MLRRMWRSRIRDRSFTANSWLARVRSSLANACFRALPPARDAVSRKGRFLGVRKMDTETLQRRLPNDTKLAGLKDKDICVFAFKDSFKPADVPLAGATRPGRYAVVAVTINHPTVVAAFIVDHLPGRFGHLR